MNLELGQIYQHRDRPDHRVRVALIREADDLNGNGHRLALAIPAAETVETCHPFDVEILCPEQPSHGDERWELVA